uniref:Uncharacterized protein n=1 Tax=Glossina brevipalpis TaxID=37001 RepID=A0A1A9X272_9MUSC
MAKKTNPSRPSPKLPIKAIREPVGVCTSTSPKTFSNEFEKVLSRRYKVRGRTRLSLFLLLPILPITVTKLPLLLTRVATASMDICKLGRSPEPSDGNPFIKTFLVNGKNSSVFPLSTSLFETLRSGGELLEKCINPRVYNEGGYGDIDRYNDKVKRFQSKDNYLLLLVISH